MKTRTIRVAALVVLSSSVYAAQSYDSYEAFYVAQPGAVFADPIKQTGDPTNQNAGVVYSY